MDLQIINVHAHGDASEEYVLLEVLAACQLNRYAIYDATYRGDGRISNKQRHFYRFSPRDVAAGEWISLRTGEGRATTVVNAAGKAIHRFYWGLGHAVWNDTGDAAVLLRIADWNTTAAG